MKLKPCPNCGRKAVRLHEKLDIGITHEIRCSHCSVMVRTRTMSRKGLEVEWNYLPRRQACPGIIPMRMVV